LIEAVWLRADGEESFVENLVESDKLGVHPYECMSELLAKY
jgi:hypothetical protein